METLRVFTAFSGYDSQCLALKRLGIPYELVGWSETDPAAIRAHDALFPQWAGRNLGDIARIDWARVPAFGLFIYSFPCTDISVAGRQRGLAEGSGTASSLLWECRRAIETKRPKYLLMENVKALLSRKFRPLFSEWERTVARMGYTNFVRVLNAKDYGVPQNRERVFMVSILGEASYHFPAPMPLRKCLGDVLEEEVAQKYFISDKMIRYIYSNSINGFKGGVNVKTGEDTCANTLTSRMHKMGRQDKFILSYTRDADGKVVRRTLKDIANTVHTSTGQGGNTDSFVIGSAQRNAYVGSVDNVSPCINAACGMGGGQTPMILQRSRGFCKGGLRDECPTITGSAWQDNNALTDGLYLRRLTPRECLRLMGVADTDIDRIQRAGISDTQQYRMAGNSIVVDVLCHIFRKLFIDPKNENRQLTLF